MLTAGAAVSVAAVALTQVILPWSDHWVEREAAYAASRRQLSRLEAMVGGDGALRRALNEERRADTRSASMLSAGATPALAASHLEVLLRGYAEQSAVQLDHMDVAGQPTPDRPGLLAIPVAVQAQGDMYGLVAFLSRMQHGQRLIVLDEITVNRGLMHGDRDVTLTWSLRVHGLYPAAARGP